MISGAGDAVERVLRQLVAAGIKSKELTVSHAFHSPLMEPMLGPFETFASGITYAEPRIGLISNVTGALADSRLVGRAAYWRQHVCEPVQFAKAVRTLYDQGVRHFLEIGPAAVLLGMARRCIADDGGQWLPSLRPGRDDWEQMLESLQPLTPPVALPTGLVSIRIIRAAAWCCRHMRFSGAVTGSSDSPGGAARASPIVSKRGASQWLWPHVSPNLGALGCHGVAQRLEEWVALEELTMA